MIISASRRTDIPSYYSDWFFRRLEAGFVCTRNPMNPKQVSRMGIVSTVSCWNALSVSPWHCPRIRISVKRVAAWQASMSACTIAA